MKFEILVDDHDEVHVLGPIEDEFGPRWGPVTGPREHAILARLSTILGYGAGPMIFPSDHARRFELHRDDDVTGVSGTGLVAEGVVFRDGVASMRWLTEWPSSVVHYERGAESVEHIHGHGGKTRIVWIDE